MRFTSSGQEVISPSNFLMYADDSLSASINVYEQPDGSGYLFPMTLSDPFNLSNGDFLSSAQLVKANTTGNITASFIVPKDSANRKAFVGLNACTFNDEVLFFVAMDSIRTNDLPRNCGLLVYHLDTFDLTMQRVDTFLDVVPAQASIYNWHQVQSSSGDVYGALLYTTTDFQFNTILYRPKVDQESDIQLVSVDIDSLPAINDSASSYVVNMKLNDTEDSLQVFLSYSDPVINQQILRVMSIDTHFTGVKNDDIYFDYFYYSANHYFSPDYWVNGIKTSNDKVVIGPKFFDVVGQAVALERYDLTSETYERALLIPDSFFSYGGKKSAAIQALDISDGNIFCLASDFQNPYDIYFDPISNHLYVGKTDTSLGQWNWYKYIGNPQTYHYPYRILATSDGGCLITCAVYDYVNNPNREHDVYIIKLDGNGLITGATNIIKSSSDKVSIYPVPTQDVLFLNYNGNEKYDFAIFDLSGKVVMRKTSLSKHDKQLSLNQLSTGSYYYKILFKSGKAEGGKLIKM